MCGHRASWSPTADVAIAGHSSCSSSAQRQRHFLQQDRLLYTPQRHAVAYMLRRGAAAPDAAANAAAATATAPSTARLYRATCELVGLEKVASAMGPLFPSALALHHFVIIETEKLTAAYDFIPQDPTSPSTAARLLSGGSVPGAAGVIRISQQVKGGFKFPTATPPPSIRPCAVQALPAADSCAASRSSAATSEAASPWSLTRMPPQPPSSAPLTRACSCCATTAAATPTSWRPCCCRRPRNHRSSNRSGHCSSSQRIQYKNCVKLCTIGRMARDNGMR